MERAVGCRLFHSLTPDSPRLTSAHLRITRAPGGIRYPKPGAEHILQTLAAARANVSIKRTKKFSGSAPSGLGAARAKQNGQIVSVSGLILRFKFRLTLVANLSIQRLLA